MDSLKKAFTKAHAFVKENKIASKGLTHFGFKKAAAHAALAGYGRRRRRRRAA